MENVDIDISDYNLSSLLDIEDCKWFNLKKLLITYNLLYFNELRTDSITFYFYSQVITISSFFKNGEFSIMQYKEPSHSKIMGVIEIIILITIALFLGC